MKDFLVYANNPVKIYSEIPQWVFDRIRLLSADLDNEGEDRYNHLDITVIPENTKMCTFSKGYTSIWADYTGFPAAVYFSQFCRVALVSSDSEGDLNMDKFYAEIIEVDFDNQDLKTLLSQTGFWYWEGKDILIQCLFDRIVLWIKED